jgi:hypothetical protein
MIERFPSFPKDSSQAKNCNKKKVRMPALFYRAAVGYAGTDTLEVLSINSGGFAYQYRYTIKVINSAKQGRADLRP